MSERNLAETRTPQNVVRLEGGVRVTNPDSTQLSYAMGLRYCDLAQEWRARTGRALCEAVITNEGTRGLQAKLLLPK